MNCTWRNKDGVHCQSEGKHAMDSKDGETWAVLCDEHEKMLSGAIERGDIPKLLAYYVMAQGGPAKAASRM